jgi:hypothetical protein
MSLRWISVVCIRHVRSLCIISFSTVRLLVLSLVVFGYKSSQSLLERVEWQSPKCSNVGKWYCPAFCGVFGREKKKKNYRSFKGCERTVVDLKPFFFFNTIYHWAPNLNFPNLLGFHFFFGTLFFFSR